MSSNNAVRTSKGTPHFTIAKINWLILFEKKIAVYTKQINTEAAETTL
jgi:hypothetical protein